MTNAQKKFPYEKSGLHRTLNKLTFIASPVPK